MVFFDSTYFLAYALFLIGASLYLRRSRTAIAHWIMVSGVVLDFFATVIPSHGFKSLAIGIGSSATIIAAIILGVVVWCLFLGAVFLRLAERHELSCVLVTIISIAWFIDLVLFLNGVYRA